VRPSHLLDRKIFDFASLVAPELTSPSEE
jgi:tRNA 2-thiocytidine biosynthesis protein TtcA